MRTIVNYTASLPHALSAGRIGSGWRKLPSNNASGAWVCYGGVGEQLWSESGRSHQSKRDVSIVQGLVRREEMLEGGESRMRGRGDIVGGMLCFLVGCLLSLRDNSTWAGRSSHVCEVLVQSVQSMRLREEIKRNLARATLCTGFLFVCLICIRGYVLPRRSSSCLTSFVKTSKLCLMQDSSVSERIVFKMLRSRNLDAAPLSMRNALNTRVCGAPRPNSGCNLSTMLVKPGIQRCHSASV